MAVPHEAVGVAFLVTGTALVAFLREPLRHPDRPGSAGFAVAVVGIVLWPLCVGAIYFLPTIESALLAWNGRVLASSIISVGWFLVAIDFTDRYPRGGRALAALAAYLLLELVVLATNPVHHLAAGPDAAIVGDVLHPDEGAWFWLQAAINYALILAATALLAVEAARSSGLRRRQSTVLTVAVVPPIAANVATIFELVDTVHDLTPFGLVGSGLLLSWALYRVDFLNVVPIARETAMEEMRDAVVTLDHRDRVVDCNAAAREWFGVDDEYVGRKPEAFFSPLSASTLDRLGSVTEDETRVSATLDGERRHASVSISPVVGPGGDLVGKVIVMRDVTRMKRREEALQARETELDLLRQVLSRTLRHNIRTELGVIRGNADMLAEEFDDADGAERIRAIRDAGENLLAISEKARSVERIVDGRADPVAQDLRRVVDDACDDVRARHPAVSIDVEGPGTCSVRASPQLPAAVENLVENAAEYAGEADPRVSVRVAGGADGVSLTVADNGPGIPSAEVAALEAKAETPLTHGSGIGLWIVKWVADRSGATLAFETDERGTTATIAFPAG